MAKAPTYQKLDEPESLDVLLVNRKVSFLHGFIWGYQLWDMEDGAQAWDKPYLNLFSPTDMELYPGQRATVIGDEIWKATPEDSNSGLVINEVQNRNFELYKNQTIQLENTIRSTIENTTYAENLLTVVNGRRVRLAVPVIMKGASIEDFFGKPLAVIQEIIDPIKQRTFIVRADYIKPGTKQ